MKLVQSMINGKRYVSLVKDLFSQVEYTKFFEPFTGRTRSNVPPETGSSSTSSSMYGVNPGDQLQQQQLHLQQHPFMPTPNRSNWDLSPLSLPHNLVDSQIFPKSHSIENISKETYNQLHHSNSYSASLWSRQQQQLQQQQQAQPSQHQQQQPVDPCDRSLVDPSVNLHRKLQRQLTLNPAGCDPRIYQMQRNASQQQQQQQQQAQHHSGAAALQLSPHRPLAPSLSGGARPNPAAQWDLHQVCFVF